MRIQHFFDSDTSTLSYVVSDPLRNAVIIDPVLNFDPASGEVSDQSFLQMVNYLQREDLNPHYVLETHVHADHLSSSQLFKEKFPGLKVGVNQAIVDVQKIFAKILNREDIQPDGKDFDFLLKGGDSLKVGQMEIKILSVPGHTPACTAFLIGDALFTGDALFMPDYGTGRCDFPGGSSETLFTSVKKLYELPDSTRVFVGHDYQPGGRELKFETTIGESKATNIHLRGETKKEDFIKFREARDLTLKSPRLLYPSLAVNIVAGHLPKSESNGISYLKIPLRPKFHKEDR